MAERCAPISHLGLTSGHLAAKGIVKGPGETQSAGFIRALESLSLEDENSLRQVLVALLVLCASEHPSAASAKTKRPRGRSTAALGRPSNDGCWTFVDSFEEGGNRYVVAREDRTRRHDLAPLTDRERQIVEHAARGLTNKEIAFALGISDATVRVLMARAARRMGVRTRRELLAHPALARVNLGAPDSGS